MQQPQQQMDTVELAKELISYETESPVGDAEIFDFLKGLLEVQGINAEIHDINGVKNLTASTGDGGTTVCLNGHVDVVPAGNGWDVTDPFDPVVENGRLYGRGATDMKGGMAAQIMAFIDLHNDPDFNGEATLMVVGDEEVGGFDGTAPLVERYEPFDYAIIGEPTDLDVQIGTRGVLWVDIFLQGASVHASRPHLTDNLTHTLPDVLNALKELEPSFDGSGILPDPTCEITIVETDGPQNSLPGEIRIGMDIRYVTSQTPQQIVSEIEDVLDRQDVTYNLEYTDHGDAFQLEDDTFRDVATEVLTDVRSREPAHITDGGASDGRFFWERGTPFIELGPDQEPVHQSDEYATVEHLKQLREAYYRITKQLAAQ